ncbi:MAG: hypothetical protein Q8R28_10070 [Dehalococcoidia bacterium]|nr:hypothetical protein [Dehalococcoidia bacterium]
MAIGDIGISLWDLLAPVLGPTMQDPPPQDQMGSSDASELWGSPVQPSRTDLFLDQQVGSDRYQDLGDEARRRALNDAIMSIGQSLGQAALAGQWSGPQGASAALMGMVPQAKGAFEKRLVGEEGLRQHQEDRAFTKEKRGFELEEQGRKRKDWQQDDASMQALNEIMPEALDDAEKFLNEVGSNVGEYDDPDEVAVNKSQLSTVIRGIRTNMKLGAKVSGEQLKALYGAQERLAKSTGNEERLAREAAEDIYKDATSAGKDPMEYVKALEETFDLKLKTIRQQLANLQKSGEIMDAQKKYYGSQTPPGEPAEGYQWAQDPNAKSGWRQVRIPSAQSEKRDIYSEQIIGKATQNGFIKQLIANDYITTKSVKIIDPEAVMLMRQLGMNQVDYGYEFTDMDKADLMRRLTSIPSASDRSPSGGVSFAGASPMIDPQMARAIAAYRAASPDGAAGETDEQIAEKVMAEKVRMAAGGN